jgi:hypothetical protein
MLHARTLSLAILATAALGVVGCGGDSGGDDESQVKDVVTSYANAIADRDGDKACGYMTEAAQKQVEAAGKALGADGCGEVIEKVTEDASDKEKDQLKDIEVTSVKIDGDRAVVQVKAAGETGDPSNLVKEDGDWKIDADNASSERPTATAATIDRPEAATVTSP